MVLKFNGKRILCENSQEIIKMQKLLFSKGCTWSDEDKTIIFKNQEKIVLCLDSGKLTYSLRFNEWDIKAKNILNAKPQFKLWF
jgi:hypothetical protein